MHLDTLMEAVETNESEWMRDFVEFAVEAADLDRTFAPNYDVVALKHESRTVLDSEGKEVKRVTLRIASPVKTFGGYEEIARVGLPDYDDVSDVVTADNEPNDHEIAVLAGKEDRTDEEDERLAVYVSDNYERGAKVLIEIWLQNVLFEL